MLAALLIAAVAAAPATDAQVRFVTSVEEAKAHVFVSRTLYAAGDAKEAALHASHPVQEIGGRITGPVARVDRALADRVREAMKRPRRDIEAKVSTADLERTAEATNATLDEAVARVVPADVARTLAFQAAVLRALVAALVNEYDEGYKNGRVTQVVEYHDAYGFLVRAQARFKDLAPALRERAPARAAAADEAFGALARALPGLSPPATPASTAAVKEVVEALRRALTVDAPAR